AERTGRRCRGLTAPQPRAETPRANVAPREQCELEDSMTATPNRRPIHRLLIANRGEIAIRIATAAAELGIETVAVYTPDDAQSLHVGCADDAIELAGHGVRGYLDAAAIIDAARRGGCDA